MEISHIDPSQRGQTIKDGLNRQASVISGLLTLGFVGLAFASLATWTVTDPSLSVSDNGEIRNMLGYPGAVFSDLAIQFMGLSAALALIPPALWGWTKLLQQKIPGFRKRIMLWPFAVMLLAAALSCLPVPGYWPLPLGLGGVTGDLSLKIPTTLGLQPVGILALLFGIPSALVGGWLLLAAGGVVWHIEEKSETSRKDLDALAEYDEEEARPSWLLGAISHYYYAYKYRASAGNAEAPQATAQTQKPGLLTRLKSSFRELTKPEDDGLEYVDHSARDPNFGDQADITYSGPEYGENNYLEPEHEVSFEDDWAPAEPPLQYSEAINENPIPVTPGRVQTMAPPPRQSSRIQREAQPSLINTEFELPSLHFLQEVPPTGKDMQLSTEALEQNARLLEGVLQDFGVKGEIINVRPGPVVTLYELEPAPGIKSSRVIGLADDIARSMSAIAARVAVVPGRNAIGIELPNSKRETVYLREILASQTYDNSKAKLPIILGKTIGGESTIADLAKMPHLLVAGTTGSGKSVAINTMILSILYRLSPEQVKLIMIDPKMLELSIYDGIPHLLTPVVTDPKKAVVALKWTVREMEERYKKMSKVGVRNIDGFNSRIAQATKKGERITRTIQTGFDRDTGEAIYETEELDLEPMPYIVVVIDEMADLMMVAGKDIEGAIQRLAQMARAAGIHVIMATQRPSVDVITGTIKANFPTRISFQVTSKIDSRTILGEQGAEQLLGMGDMLYMAGGGRIQRVHGPFVDDGEVDKVVQHLKAQGVPQYLDSVTEEDEEETVGASGDAGGLAESNDIYDQAVAIVLRDRKVSTSYIQRRLSIGYNRAASLIERMEQEGLISPANHAGKREILVPGEDETI
ncbi:MAG: DNA translocase FtsK 4TM domain-containing protein [Pseudomonadota bacterium]